MKKVAEKQAETSPKLIPRPPVAVVMGHIDHGKTTLLDAIRKTSVASAEAGGITQAIGAYQTEYHGKKITFIDTPGHEAFSSMRARGAHVADIAILVVAADEGVKPQTEEAIRIMREGELPLVVVINKIDKANADPNRVKKELAEREVLVEGFGGTVPVVNISAKSGQGLENLLETILLLAELEELKTDPARPGEGVVIESHIDPKRGATATLLIEDGTVERGDFIVIGNEIAPVRIFENFQGQAIDRATASQPIRITGFSRPPGLGELFSVFRSRDEAEAHRGAREVRREMPPAIAPGEEAKTVVNIILKTDVLGSKEAVEAAIRAIASPQLANRIVKSDVGDITESDVKLAAATANAIIVGFRVKMPPVIRELALRSGVNVVLEEVIYELIDKVKAAMLAAAPAELKRLDLGRTKILALFKADRSKQIVGGRVETGKIKIGARFDLIRNNVKIGSGKVLQLQSNRRDAEEVGEGQEFGILTDADTTIAAGDGLEIFTEEKVIPQL